LLWTRDFANSLVHGNWARQPWFLRLGDDAPWHIACWLPGHNAPAIDGRDPGSDDVVDADAKADAVPGPPSGRRSR
jgi:hypothetical protein